MSFPCVGSEFHVSTISIEVRFVAWLRVRRGRKPAVDAPLTSKVFPDLAATHSPLIYATFFFNNEGSLSFGTVCFMLAALKYVEGNVYCWDLHLVARRAVLCSIPLIVNELLILET